MASERAVAAALKMLGRAFAGVVDVERVELYRAALEDLSDEQLQVATTLVIRNHTGEFIPPPAVLRRAVAPAPIAVDSMAIIRRIEKRATYNANVGMIYPPTAVVHEQLGEAAAYAYAAAGGPRLFSDDATSRDIAAGQFTRAMVEAATRPQALLPVIGPESLGSDSAHVDALIRSTAKRLSAPEPSGAR